MAEKPFFVGYLSVPPGLRAFLAVSALCLVALFAFVGWTVATTQADPMPGGFSGRQTLTGVLSVDPYPWVHVTTGSDAIPAGRPVLLSAPGKSGVAPRAAGLDGQVVEISGGGLRRGDLDLVQVRGGARGLSPVEGASAPAPRHQDLGRWRLTGEICDGKCYAGAMSPGTGLAHRACANLCLIGGVPPVFVSTKPVDGEAFLLLANADGLAVTEQLLDHVALRVELEGRIERRGNLLVFRAAPETLRVLP
ncbi:MAG: hypothetical protein AAF281_03435 [Pseudomonadota bacterium]